MIGPDDFERFVKIAKAQGVQSLKLEGLEIVFHVEQQPIISVPPNTEGMPTEDQMLLWSTPFMPDHKKIEDS